MGRGCCSSTLPSAPWGRSPAHPSLLQPAFGVFSPLLQVKAGPLLPSSTLLCSSAAPATRVPALLHFGCSQRSSSALSLFPCCFFVFQLKGEGIRFLPTHPRCLISLSLHLAPTSPVPHVGLAGLGHSHPIFYKNSGVLAAACSPPGLTAAESPRRRLGVFKAKFLQDLDHSSLLIPAPQLAPPAKLDIRSITWELIYFQHR